MLVRVRPTNTISNRVTANSKIFWKQIVRLCTPISCPAYHVYPEFYGDELFRFIYIDQLVQHDGQQNFDGRRRVLHRSCDSADLFVALRQNPDQPRLVRCHHLITIIIIIARRPGPTIQNRCNFFLSGGGLRYFGTLGKKMYWGPCSFFHYACTFYIGTLEYCRTRTSRPFSWNLFEGPRVEKLFSCSPVNDFSLALFLCFITLYLLCSF